MPWFVTVAIIFSPIWLRNRLSRGAGNGALLLRMKKRFNRESFYKRIAHLIPYQLLWPKKVIVVGAGSGGSRIAMHLGRLGIFVMLLDRPGERLELHNIVRHALGLDSLGKLKIRELAKLIRRLNPDAKVQCMQMDVAQNHLGFGELIEKIRPDLILPCTDNQESKHAIDAAGVRHGIPTCGAGVYDGGVGGEVYRTKPNGPCYGCIAGFLQIGREQSNKPQAIDYNNLNIDELRSTCALSLDIEQIALIHARVSLSMLLPQQTEAFGIPAEPNLFVFSNRTGPGGFDRPLHCDFYYIPKNPTCLVCGMKKQDTQEAERILKSLEREN